MYGAVLGLRAVALILCGALYTAAVDPDEVLRLFRRGLVPLGADRDAGHADGAGAARATRGGWPTPSAAGPGRRRRASQLMRATTSGVLDRALDVAAALEVRGYGAARSGAPRRGPEAVVAPRPRVRRLGGRDRRRWRSARASPAWLRSRPIRRCTRRSAPGALAVAAALVACALLPFADRRGIEPMSVLELRRGHLHATRARPRRRSRRHPRDRARRAGRAGRRRRARASRRCCARRAASCPTSTAARSPAGRRSRGHGHPRARPRRAGGARSGRCSRTPRRRS